MKTKNILLTVLVLTSMSIFTACGDDNSSNSPDACNGFVWSQQIEDELVAFSEAAAEYSSDPTVQKCQIYKDAAIDYVDALRGINVSCITEANEQDYQTALSETEASIDEIVCSDS